MKTNAKKLMSIVGAATLSLGMMVSISANASSSDTYWSSGNSYTRDKDNASSVYVQNVSDYYYSWVTVYGRKSGVNTDYEVNYNPATGQTLTDNIGNKQQKSLEYTLSQSQPIHIVNAFVIGEYGFCPFSANSDKLLTMLLYSAILLYE